MDTTPPNIEIFIDADACPVRDETFRVAERHDVPVSVVANSYIRIPKHPLFSFHMVTDSFDAADDYIADRAHAHAVVITSDILLAERCLSADAKVLAPNGKPFDTDNIGSAIAMRAIMADLRAGADMPNAGGPPPFSASDRSTFLQSLHNVVERLKRGA